MTETLGIIGTAGRGPAIGSLDMSVFRNMARIARQFVREHSIGHIVSGGAAWADHSAVGLVRLGAIKPEQLTLHLPAPIISKGGRMTYDPVWEASGTANFYHAQFEEKTGIRGIDQIWTAITQGSKFTVSPGFHARNRMIARDAHVLLAFVLQGDNNTHIPPFAATPATGDDPHIAGIEDGSHGTAHTWRTSKTDQRYIVTIPKK